MDPIRRKIDNLVQLAKRPGTAAEGAAARDAAIRLSLKYGIICEFTYRQPPPRPTPVPKPTARPTPKPPTPEPPQPESEEAMFYPWIKALEECGWFIKEYGASKVGPQIRFRKPGTTSEVRVAQRKNSEGKDFDAEHIMHPDLDEEGNDWSYTRFMTMSLSSLIRHLKNPRFDFTQQNNRPWWATKK